jgi:hypothetical protein
MPNTLTVTPAAITRAGVNQTAAFQAAQAAEFILLTPNMFLVIANNSGGNCTVSLTITTNVDGVTPAPKTVTIANTKTYVIGPFPVGTYSTTDAPTLVGITYSTTTSVTICAFTLTPAPN